MATKHLHHRINLSPDDVKQAILFWLTERDRPRPNGENVVTSSYKIDESGVELAWCETYDEKVY